MPWEGGLVVVLRGKCREAGAAAAAPNAMGGAMLVGSQVMMRVAVGVRVVAVVQVLASTVATEAAATVPTAVEVTAGEQATS